MSGWRALRCSTRRSRVSGGNRTRMVRLGRSAPELFGHGHTEQGRKDLNPLRAGWSRTALPGARPCRSAAPAGLEPAPLPLTAGCTTIVLRGNSQRTEQDSNLIGAGARLSQGPMTGAPRRFPTCPAVRTAGFEPAFSSIRNWRPLQLVHVLSQFRRLGSSQRPSPFQGDALTA